MPLRAIVLLIYLPLVLLAEKKTPPLGQMGNENLDISAKAIVDRTEIHNTLGADLGEGYVLVQATVSVRSDKPVSVSLNDFELLSHNDGQRSTAFTPSQIAGKGALVVTRPNAKTSKTSVGGGMGPFGGGSPGVTLTNDMDAKTTMDEKSSGDSPLFTILKNKVFPEKEISDTESGLLYFPIEGKKIKLKDLALIYKGPGGRMVLEFGPSSK